MNAQECQHDYCQINDGAGRLIYCAGVGYTSAIPRRSAASAIASAFALIMRRPLRS